ncbi:Stealth CR1 domain-containing protein [Lactobacillus sp. DCY120]|uniref:Stealth CR1 domain-containing protein n=1 Tax=Bombilactobacillus apium TaxID=2675299 RepID=A0A850QZ93_9LACO|nr:stealth family protein [Bombilactobacillus apium]NVY96089.1 Stealth CR1 domain-containing protein [Bombilactobacillus apium]
MRASQISFPIDFVIPWVDGADPKWQARRAQYLPASKNSSTAESKQRYHDWGTLKFLLRSIARFAPWVNQIWLLTDQQVPTWLDLKTVHLVDHREFIPALALPTFNSNVIEMNVAHIPGLSEHFILLNDDLLFTQAVNPQDFFTAQGAPKDTLSQFVLMPRDDFSHIPVNNISLINQQFSKRTWLRHNWPRALSLKNGFLPTMMSLFLSVLPYFTRFYDPHVGVSYTKANFEQVLKLYPQAYQQLLQNKFRDRTDISHWLVRYYQIVSGQVSPRSYHFGQYLTMTEPDRLAQILEHPRKTRMLALNDKTASQADITQAQESLKILAQTFPQKAIYEQ